MQTISQAEQEIWDSALVLTSLCQKAKLQKTKAKWLKRWCSEKFGPEDSSNEALDDEPEFEEKIHHYNTRRLRRRVGEPPGTSNGDKFPTQEVDKENFEDSDDEEESSSSKEEDDEFQPEPTSPKSNKRSREHHTDKLPRKKLRKGPLSKAAPTRTVGVEDSVKEALSTAGVSAESIVRLINNIEDRSEVIKKTGFSNNYLMKLQRKVLHSSNALKLREPDEVEIGGVTVHVLFDSNNTALFINKELCDLLSIKGTTFSYWKKKSEVAEIDTASDFRLMDQCRSIFGGRSTYNLITAESLLKILANMEHSRQKNTSVEALNQITRLASRYLSEDDGKVHMTNA